MIRRGGQQHHCCLEPDEKTVCWVEPKGEEDIKRAQWRSECATNSLGRWMITRDEAEEEVPAFHEEAEQGCSAQELAEQAFHEEEEQECSAQELAE